MANPPIDTLLQYAQCQMAADYLVASYVTTDCFAIYFPINYRTAR